MGPPVPCDLQTSRLATTVLVTGPNSGGKTRLLQSLGLTQLLAQSGLFIPARSARGRARAGARDVADRGDARRPIRGSARYGADADPDLFERLPPGAMVLLDELCSAPTPRKARRSSSSWCGHAVAPRACKPSSRPIFCSSRAPRAGAEDPEPGRFCRSSSGQTAAPHYQFTPGVAATSLAGHAAERLGVTGDQLLALIERNIQKRKTNSAPLAGQL